MNNPFGRDLIYQAGQAEQEQAEPSKTSEEATRLQTDALAGLIGIVAMNAIETIVGDIEVYIELGERKTLNGYINCLSKIMKHETAWHCIQDAFQKKSEPVPGKYYPMFGKSKKTEDPHTTSGMTVT